MKLRVGSHFFFHAKTKQIPPTPHINNDHAVPKVAQEGVGKRKTVSNNNKNNSNSIYLGKIKKFSKADAVMYHK